MLKEDNADMYSRLTRMGVIQLSTCTETLAGVRQNSWKSMVPEDVWPGHIFERYLVGVTIRIACHQQNMESLLYSDG